MKRKSLGFLALSVSALLVLQTPATAMAGVWVYGDTNLDEEQGTHEGDVVVDGNSLKEDEKYDTPVGANNLVGDSEQISTTTQQLTVKGDVTTKSESLRNDGDEDYYPPSVNASNGAEININGNVSSENANAVNADKWHDEATSGGKVYVTGNVSSDKVFAANADGSGSSITISGDATSKDGSAVGAFNGGSVTVGGDVKSNNAEAPAVSTDNGKVTVAKDVSASEGSAIDANKSSVIVGGNVIAKDTGICARSGNIDDVEIKSNITVDGDVTAENTAVDTHGSNVNINGNISANNGVLSLGSNVTIGGDVSSNEEQAITASASTITVKGNVHSNKGWAINSDSSNVTVNGNVSSDENSAIVASYNSSGITIDGNVTGGVIKDNDNTVSNAINMDNRAAILVKGNVETANKGLDNETAVIITPIKEAKTGKLIVLGNITAHGKEGNAIWIDTSTDSNNVKKDFTANDLPEIIVGSLNADKQDLLVGFEFNNGKTESDNDELLESIYDSIMYYIDIKQPDNGKIDVTGAFSSDGYLVAHEDDSISISVSPNEGYEVDSVAGGKVNVIKNADGTYTVEVPRGGGIKISALLKAIEKVIPPSSEAPVIKVTSSKKSDDTPSTPVLTAAKSYSVFNNTIQKDITSVPQNGTLKIDMGNWISFNKKTFELLSKRSDVAITITYKYKGQTYRVTIPAGYPIMDLLDENGYCGCLYLNSIFGSELVTQ